MTIPAGFAAVSVQYNQAFNLQPEQVTFGIEAAAYDEALADFIIDKWRENFAPVCYNGDTIGPAVIRTSDNLVFSSTGAATAGTESGEGDSCQTAYLIQKNTARGGRSGRGRWFLPGTVEPAINSGGSLTSGIQTDLLAAADGFLADLGAADVGLFLLHADGSTPDEITSFTVKNLVATQRRRLGR